MSIIVKFGRARDHKIANKNHSTVCSFGIILGLGNKLTSEITVLLWKVILCKMFCFKIFELTTKLILFETFSI